MLIGQDWASADYLNGPIRPYLIQLGYDPNLATNKNLHGLLSRHFLMPFSSTYATNAFPFIKLGAMNASIATQDMIRCAADFLVPQIEIVKPKVAICLGLHTFNALRRALKLGSISPLDTAIKQPFVHAEAIVCAAAHTGRRGTNQRGIRRVDEDWATMGSLLERPPQ
jgi:restriction system protein